MDYPDLQSNPLVNIEFDENRMPNAPEVAPFCEGRWL